MSPAALASGSDPWTDHVCCVHRGRMTVICCISGQQGIGDKDCVVA